MMHFAAETIATITLVEMRTAVGTLVSQSPRSSLESLDTQIDRHGTVLLPSVLGCVIISSRARERGHLKVAPRRLRGMARRLTVKLPEQPLRRGIR